MSGSYSNRPNVHERFNSNPYSNYHFNVDVAYGYTTAPPIDSYKFSFSSSEGNWNQLADVYETLGEPVLSLPAKKKWGEGFDPSGGGTLITTPLEGVGEEKREIDLHVKASPLTVYSKKSTQEYVHEVFDEMPIDEEVAFGLSSSICKENSSHMMSKLHTHN